MQQIKEETLYYFISWLQQESSDTPPIGLLPPSFLVQQRDREDYIERRKAADRRNKKCKLMYVVMQMKKKLYIALITHKNKHALQNIREDWRA